MSKSTKIDDARGFSLAFQRELCGSETRAGLSSPWPASRGGRARQEREPVLFVLPSNGRDVDVDAMIDDVPRDPPRRRGRDLPGVRRASPRPAACQPGERPSLRPRHRGVQLRRPTDRTCCLRDHSAANQVSKSTTSTRTTAAPGATLTAPSARSTTGPESWTTGPWLPRTRTATRNCPNDRGRRRPLMVTADEHGRPRFRPPRSSEAARAAGAPELDVRRALLGLPVAASVRARILAALTRHGQDAALPGPPGRRDLQPPSCQRGNSTMND